MDGDVERPIAVEDIEPGDLLRIRPGERVPVDGEVMKGKPCGRVHAHGRACRAPDIRGPCFRRHPEHHGALVMRASHVGEDTVLARIVRLVRDAQGSKAPIAALADTVSFYFVPVVMLLAVLAGFPGTPSATRAFLCLRIAVSVLVIACPCAMG